MLNLKVKQWGNLIDINLMRDIHEIDDYIIKIEVFIGDYFNLYGKFEICYGNLYEVEYAKIFKKKTTEMYEEIRMAKLLKQNLLEVMRNAKIEAFEKSKWVT